MWWICVALTVAGFVSCGGGSQPGYRLGAELASAIPADTVTLAGGRLDLVQQGAVFAKLQPNLPSGPLDEFAKRFGVDPRKDIKEFVVAYNGRDALMLASGNFAASALLDRVAAEAGATRGEYKGKPIVSRDRGGLAALSKTVLAAGSTSRLHEAIDRMAQGSKLDERWAAGLRSLPASAQLWFLSSGGATLNLPQGSNLGNIDKILGSVDGIAGWADLSTNLHMAANATARDAAAAKQLHTQLRGLIGMGRLSTPDNRPELLKFYDAIQTKLDDKKIEIDIDMPPAVLEDFLKQMRP